MYKDIFGKTRQKVGLHIHTTNSDGKATPEEVIEIYKAHGYDAIAFTDHNRYNEGEKKDGIKFEYDFGDSWIHKVWLKGIREYDSNETPGLKKLKGKGACPPEDCGGLGGYDYILRLLNEKGLSQEEREHLRWYGIDTDFDPNIFDIEYSIINLDELWKEATL